MGPAASVVDPAAVMMIVPDDPMAIVAACRGFRLARFAVIEEVDPKWRPSGNRSWMYLCLDCGCLFWPEEDLGTGTDPGVLFPSRRPRPGFDTPCACHDVEQVLRLPAGVHRPGVPFDFDTGP